MKLRLKKQLLVTPSQNNLNIVERARATDRAVNNSFVFKNDNHPHGQVIQRRSNHIELSRTSLTQGDKSIANSTAITLDTTVSVTFYCWVNGNLRTIAVACTEIPKELQ
jgi:hypothetical protein